MTITAARKVASNPQQYSTQQLDDALTAIVDCPSISEQQVSNLQAKIEPELRSRIGI